MTNFLTRFALIVALLAIFSVTEGRTANECAALCNDLRRDVLSREICRDAKKQLPRPKIGDFCDMGMEQAYSDACIALCQEEKAVSRIAQTCRAAAIEMPRPTVRKWCEHGYNAAFDKTKRDVGRFFYDEKMREQQREQQRNGGKDGSTSVKETAPQQATQQATQQAPATSSASATRKVLTSVPINLDDTTLDLNVYEGETAEDATIAFCKIHLKDDMSGCIRQLLPNVLDAMSSS